MQWTAGEDKLLRSALANEFWFFIIARMLGGFGVGAALIVAPMHIARGIQNKVLEAMAMSKPVVVTTMGLEGISAQHGKDVLIADTPETFIKEITELFKSGTGGALGTAARKRVCKDFSWNKTLQEFDRWLA